MEQQVLFPGQETGIVRVLIKQSEHEESYQLLFDFFDEELIEDS